MAKVGLEPTSWDCSSKALLMTLFSSTALFMKKIRKLRVMRVWGSFKLAKMKDRNRVGGDVS